MTPEGKIKAKLNKALKDFPYVWKFMPVQMGMGAPALDYILCVAGGFIAIEAKKPGGKVTPRQRNTIDAINEAGGVVFIVEDDETLAAALSFIAHKIAVVKNRW